MLFASKKKPAPPSVHAIEGVPGAEDDIVQARDGTSAASIKSGISGKSKGKKSDLSPEEELLEDAKKLAGESGLRVVLTR